MINELKPCPFCGGEANFERRGTSRQSCIVTCGNCGCFLETGEEDWTCGMQWNTRTVNHKAVEMLEKMKKTVWREDENIDAVIKELKGE